jgi:hypothetical protein
MCARVKAGSSAVKTTLGSPSKEALVALTKSVAMTRKQGCVHVVLQEGTGNLE